MRATLILVTLLLVTASRSVPRYQEVVPETLEDGGDPDLAGLRIMLPVSRMASLTVPEPGYNILSSRYYSTDIIILIN